MSIINGWINRLIHVGIHSKFGITTRWIDDLLTGVADDGDDEADVESSLSQAFFLSFLG
jgi:hypothetical protein